MTTPHRYDSVDMFDDFERAAKGIERLQDRALAPLGLTKAQFNVLREIALQRLPRPYKDIAAELRCDPTTVSDAAGLLAAKGLVEITDDTRDRRRRAVKATAEGRKAFSAAVQARKALSDELLGLIDGETDALPDALGQLARILTPPLD